MLTIVAKSLYLLHYHSSFFRIKPDFSNSEFINSDSLLLVRNFKINYKFEVINSYSSDFRRIFD
jgi:hypothetical protein